MKLSKPSFAIFATPRINQHRETFSKLSGDPFENIDRIAFKLELKKKEEIKDNFPRCINNITYYITITPSSKFLKTLIQRGK